MASLLGKADSTLVAASFKAAQADVPKDLSSVYEKREEAFKTFQEGISGIFTNLNKEDKEWGEKFDTQVELAKDTLLKNPKVNDHMLTKFHEQVDGLRETWKNAKTDLEKSQARAALNQFTEQSTGADTMLAEIVEDHDLIIFEPNSNEKKLLTAMLDDYNKNGKTTNATWDKGKKDWVYTLPGSSGERWIYSDEALKKEVYERTSDDLIENPDYIEGGFKMTLTEIRNAIGTKDLTAETNASKVINGIITSKTGQPWESDDQNNIPGRRNDVYDDIMATMPKDNDVLNMGRANLPGQRFSVEDLLMGKVPQGYNNPVAAELFDVLETLDLDGDGTPGDEDDVKMANNFTTSENGAALARQLMKDKSLYKEIIANSWTDISGAKMANIKKKEDTPKWQIPGTTEWKNVMEYNKSLNNPTVDQPPFKDIWYGPKGNNVQGQTLNNIWSMLQGGTIKIGDIPYNRNEETNAWVNSQDQTEMSGDEILKEFQKQAKGYNLMQDPNFKKFSGATTSGTYTMPKDQESTVAKLWERAAAGADGSSEKFAVSTLNTTFGGGFTQEDAGNKWIVGYNGYAYNLKDPTHKDLLIRDIKKQKLIDQKLDK